MNPSGISYGDFLLQKSVRGLSFVSLTIFFWLIPAFVARGWNGPLGLQPDSSGIGILPFEWSGHWGITHTYGFPGWGRDFQDGPILLDGNFAHWSRRYAFPFRRRPQPSEEVPAVQSAVWYRRGDYHLDEFAIDVAYGQQGGPISRFQGMKRNFDDQYGLLGPTSYPGAGGTIQQNYKLEMTFPADGHSLWQFGLTYLRTSDAVPFSSPSEVSKAFLRLDRILGAGMTYKLDREDRAWTMTASAFSQRLRMRPQQALPRWSADVIAYRVKSHYRHSLSPQMILFLESDGKFSAVSSDTLGNQDRTIVIQNVGLQRKKERWSARIAAGGGLILPDQGAFLYEGRIRYQPSWFALSGSIDRSFHVLPYQWNGKPFWFQSFSIPTQDGIHSTSTVVPDSNAVSQVRTVARVGLEGKMSRLDMEVEYFLSRAEPHYTFVKQWMFEVPDRTRLVRKESDSAQGVFWHGKVTYFRDWWMEVSGLSFIENKPGWGHGVQHEGRVTLGFRESLFNGRLDFGMKLWGTVWGGRRPFVWNPALGLGYEDYRDVRDLFPQDWTGVVNVRFEAVVSTFEIAFTMVNLLYSGRDLIQNVTGSEIPEDLITFTASPSFPASGRLAFLEFSWRFED